MTPSIPTDQARKISPASVLAALGAAVIVLDAATPWLHHRFGSVAFVMAMSAHAIAAYFAYRQAQTLKGETGLWLVLSVAAVLRILLLVTEPYLSTDVWRYVWDGRVQGAGINPYLYVPAAPELSPLRDTAVYPNINRADYAPTIYPPTAQWVFFLITRISDSMLGMKAGMLAFDVATIGAILALLRRLGRPLALVAAYAWHPLPVWEIAGNGHVDAVMMALLTWGLWAEVSGATASAGLLASLAALSKPTALLALPVFWRPWHWRLVLITLAVLTLMYVPFLSAGWKVLGFGQGYLREEGLTTGTGFWLPQIFMQARELPTWATAGYLALSAALLIGLALWAGFRRDRTPEATISFLLLSIMVFLDLLSSNYPWYFLAAMPFLPLTRAVSPWILTSGGFAFYDVIAPFDPTWLPLRWTKVALYLATTLAIAYDIYTGRLPGRRKSGADKP